MIYSMGVPQFGKLQDNYQMLEQVFILYLLKMLYIYLVSMPINAPFPAKFNQLYLQRW